MYVESQGKFYGHFTKRPTASPIECKSDMYMMSGFSLSHFHTMGL